MLVVSKERYLPVTVNTLVLSANETYFYIHRDVYDQAIILSDRYDTLAELAELVGGYDHNDDTVQWFYEQAPKPLHSLAPFLALIDGRIEPDIELCCGVLHVITSLINARHFVRKPLEVRKSVSFSLSIKEEYEMAWDRFFVTALPYEQRNSWYGMQPMFVPNAPLANVAVEVQQKQSNAQAVQSETQPVASIPQAATQTAGLSLASPDATTLLEGFSYRKEEEEEAPVSAKLASTNAERKAIKNLLSL
ncbi:hypothetical protein ACFQZE_10890 [Paenibacillus sp. GCM10027627]|uniref:hypothetical protein n=1 Tax=unclassified Paenibacillus TaxID=185978 RepID=UPI00363DBB1C